MIPGGMILPWGGNLSPSLSSLILWLDAADASTFTLTGALVDQWNDKSGNANHHTPSGTGVNDHRPTKSGNGVVFAADGLPLNDVKGLAAAGVLIGGGAFSYYLVWKRVMQRDDVILHQDGATYAYLQYSGNWYVGNTLQANAFANDTIAVKSARGDHGTALVTRATNGVEAAEQSFTGSATIQAIGASNSYAGGFDGTVYELLVYNARISDTANTKTINYLKNKWGI